MNIHKFFFLFIAVFGWHLGLKALPVDQETAQTVAGKYTKTDHPQLSAIYYTVQHDVALSVVPLTWILLGIMPLSVGANPFGCFC